jgi:hypothetical protein
MLYKAISTVCGRCRGAELGGHAQEPEGSVFRSGRRRHLDRGLCAHGFPGRVLNRQVRLGLVIPGDENEITTGDGEVNARSLVALDEK